MSPSTPIKHYFYHGHRKPSGTLPVVRGSAFTHRSLVPSPSPSSSPPSSPVNFRDWDSSLPSSSSSSLTPPLSVSQAARRLSPLARYILSSLHRHRRWSPPVLSDLSKLRRVTPDLVAEVLRSRPALPPSLSSRFFHWAGKQKGFRHTFASYNALAYALNECHLFRAADQLPELMHSQGKPPTEKQLEILIRMHADAGRGLRLHHVYTKMRDKFGIRPRIFLYNRILDALIRTSHLDLALSVYDDLRADGLKEEPITFTILAKGLCQAGRIQDALQLLDTMRSAVCRPDVFAYTAMIKVLAANTNLDGCLKVWEEMKRDVVEPDVMAYATVISMLCKSGNAEKGNELFREMKEKKLLIDRSIYRALVEGFVAVGRVGVGCELLKEMMGDGYQADLAIYDSLIGGLCGAGRADKAYKLFQIVVEEGLIPGLETVTPILCLYVDKDEIDSFFKLVDRISNLGLPVMVHLSNFFAYFVAKEGRELKGVELFEALKGRGFCSTAIYNILIKCLHKVNQMKRAIMLFEEMKCSKDFQPDSSTYNHIIPCFVEEGDVRQACSCYNQMKEMYWTPSVAAYCSLVGGLCKISEITPAIALVKDCLGNVTTGPMEFKYTLSVLNACRSRKPEKVLGVIDEMMEQGYPLEEIICCAVIHGFCQYAHSGEARKVFSIMRDRNLLTEAKFITYEDMLDEHLKQKAASLVISGLKFFNLESKLTLTSSVD